MIKEVLGLGISGAQLVVSTLKKINKEKEQFKKRATMALSSEERGRLEAIRQERTNIRERKELESGGEEKKTTVQDHVDNVLKVGQGLATLQAGAATKALVEGIAGAVSIAQPELAPFSNAVAQSAGMIIDSAQNFVTQVRNASAIFADTQETKSRAFNLTGNSEFIRNQRVDLDMNSQRALVEGLGSKYGVVQEHLRRSIEGVFAGNTDIHQATSLAQGNFNALGDDKGFFMQKIADSFSGLPPSIRQELTASMLDMIPKESLMKENVGAQEERANVTGFDNLDRIRAAGMAANAPMAQNIQSVINRGDDALVNGMGELASGIGDLIDGIGSLKETIKNAGATGTAIMHPIDTARRAIQGSR